MFMLLGLMGAVLVGSAVMLQTDVLEDEDIPEGQKLHKYIKKTRGPTSA